MSDARRVVLVTGAGSGMGLQTALRLAERGDRVYASVRNDEEASALAREAAARGVELAIPLMDLCRGESVEATRDRILAEAGRIDVLVHFAGAGLRGFFEDLDLDEIRELFEINVFGAMRLLQAVLPPMRAARSGRILLTTSVAGRIGSMSIGAYASSKFAMEGLVECLAQEVAPFGIHVSLLEPGLVLTERFTRDRKRARRALLPSSPYHDWFLRHEALVDDLLKRQSLTPAGAALAVERILAARRPRLRYVLGTKARIIVSLRRHVPGEWFDRIYFGFIRRWITRPRPGERDSA